MPRVAAGMLSEVDWASPLYPELRSVSDARPPGSNRDMGRIWISDSSLSCRRSAAGTCASFSSVSSRSSRQPRPASTPRCPAHAHALAARMRKRQVAKTATCLETNTNLALFEIVGFDDAVQEARHEHALPLAVEADVRRGFQVGERDREGATQRAAVHGGCLPARNE